MLRISRRWLPLALFALLAACGNKGDLVRPPPAPGADSTAPGAPNR